jgi:hypothetical protein
MIKHIFGTINKRIDVGRDKTNDTIFIHASSNCINFTPEELDCLISVLTTLEVSEDCLNKIHINLWEPSTPPAEEKFCCHY